MGVRMTIIGAMSMKSFPTERPATTPVATIE
jgi:hypothetical protein